MNYDITTNKNEVFLGFWTSLSAIVILDLICFFLCLSMILGIVIKTILQNNIKKIVKIKYNSRLTLLLLFIFFIAWGCTCLYWLLNNPEIHNFLNKKFEIALSERKFKY